MYGHGLRAVSRPARVLLFPQCRSLSNHSSSQRAKPFIAKLARDMIKAASNPPPGWVGTPQSELTLLSDAQTKQLDRAPSMERMAFQATDNLANLDEDESGFHDASIDPGTMVELRRSVPLATKS